MNPVAIAKPEAQQRRLAICASCPYRVETLIPLTKARIARCAKCGCVLSAKVKFARATCPINKW